MDVSSVSQGSGSHSGSVTFSEGPGPSNSQVSFEFPPAPPPSQFVTDETHASTPQVDLSDGNTAPDEGGFHEVTALSPTKLIGVNFHQCSFPAFLGSSSGMFRLLVPLWFHACVSPFVFSTKQKKFQTTNFNKSSCLRVFSVFRVAGRALLFYV